MLDKIIHIIETSNPLWAYLSLFISAFIENIFPPAPADTVVVLGAYFVGMNVLNGWMVYLSTTLGSTAGFLSMFGFAYWLEKGVLEKKYMYWIEKESIVKIENWFRLYGYWIIFGNRFLAGLRSLISLVAGFSKLNFKKVFIYSLISAAIWNGMLILAGYKLGENWEKIDVYLKNYSLVIIFLIVIFIIVWYFVKRKK
ncbi:MAG: DedA family protein [Calditrichia bacterium]|nr:DedA family protein [Calditrichia bacterium]